MRQGFAVGVLPGLLYSSLTGASQPKEAASRNADYGARQFFQSACWPGGYMLDLAANTAITGFVD